MKYFNYFFALYWFGYFVSLFFGYKPNTLTIGVSFLMSSICFLNFNTNK